MAKTKIKTLKHQTRFLKSDAEECMLLGGIGSGKSAAGGMFTLKMIADYPHTPGIVVAPTYSQLIKATVKAITDVFEAHGVKHDVILSGANKRIELPGRESIHLFTLEKPDNFRGPEAGWLLGDEVAFAKEYGIKVAKGRIRHKKGPLFKRYTTSPNGFNWAYDEFEHKDGTNATKRRELVRAVTKDNIFLPDSYYEGLLEDYGGADNPLAQQELFGQFVNLQAGAIYWAWDRTKYVGEKVLNPAFPVYVGQDFNIGNMCNVYVQIIGGHYYFFKETKLDFDGANTDHASQKIVEDLRGFQIYVIADSTGKAELPSAGGRTNIEIMKSYGLTVLHSSNPFIRDRQNSFNALMKQGRVTVHPSCTNLIKEFETLSSRDKEGETAHCSVGGGYIVWKFDPLMTRGRTSVTQL